MKNQNITKQILQKENPSLENIKIAVCTDKDKFDNKHIATAVMDAQHKRNDKIKLNVYYCNFCSKYHIGAVSYKPANTLAKDSIKEYRRINNKTILCNLYDFYDEQDEQDEI